MKSFILGFFLVLATACWSPAQQLTKPPSAGDSNTTTAIPATAGQAPDDATRKIAELVHAGKYAEAQQLTTGLLVAYPDDQRLVKARAMLEKLLTAAGSAAPATNSNPPSNNSVSAPPPPHSNAEQLTGMDKVDYSALIELAKQAQQTSDLPEQQQLLQQFMDQSSLFLQKHPDQILLWQLRAASAISLNRPLAGYDAAQKLLAAGAADSTDANLQRLLAQLKNKGWLDKQEAEKLYEQQRYILVAFLGEASDKPTNINLRTKLILDMTALLLSQYPSRQIHYTTPAPSDPAPILMMTITVHDTTLSPCTYSMVKNVWKCPAQTALAVVASSPQGWKFDKTYTFTGGTSGVGWGVPRTPLNADELNSWISHGVLGVFKGILDADAVRAALLGNPTPIPAVQNAHSSEPMGNPAPEPAVPAAHSSAPVDNPAPLAATSNTTVLHVYRPHHLTAAAQKPYIYIDGKKITPIANSQEVRMLLTPGKHTISVSKKYLENELPINDLEMAAGNEYWIRVDISAGAWAAHSKLYIVPTDQARLESHRMEEIRIGDVSMN